MTRVAITGFGAVTPVGNDVPSTWSALVAGRSGVGRLTTFDSTTFRIHIGGMVKNFDAESRLPDRRLHRYLSRGGGFGVAAVLEAAADANAASAPYAPEDKAISMAGSVGRPPLDEVVEMLHVRASSDRHRLMVQAPSAVVERAQNVPVALMAQLTGSRGPATSINTACAASAHSIGEGFRWIQDGAAKMVFAGGYDALTTYLDVLGFSLLGALTTDHAADPERASRPFDRDRSGFVIGEGAIVAVLEDLEGARARGAHIYAEIAGFGSSLNAYRITDSPPDGNGAVQAMSRALRESAVPLDGIDYVVAHGTSTPGNDLSETVAIRRVFGEYAGRLAISSPKSMTGHLTAAAGALNVLVGALAIHDRTVPPTINLEHPDPKLDLDYVPGVARHLDVRAALVNAFAFGGTNACLVLKAAA